MSPRSREFMQQANERLAVARDMIAAGHPTAAVGQAYYAMLYAARAALSERDQHAKTHSRVWTLFAEEFVRSGAVPTDVGGVGQRTQRTREQADYEAEEFDEADARTILTDAERFVAAIRAALGDAPEA